ncbi:hypothetical protein M407DRAFT_198801 [Tulasnella calospora MUT 4182]|uniref:DUF6534 domain-containing protein n=1 Tax=Tulasnella calospora MUT 4182 TaxID=1051891 RepID=A0A0C3MI13_9AGAM|nr:hypothetical protein M407DRAFT_198801 [Tulasnella calospora MUT 4182]
MMDPVIGKGPSAIDYAIEHTKNDRVGSYGPWLAALLAFTFMMGVITSQSTRYFSTFGFESRGLFTIVVLCIALVLTQWIVLVHVSWEWFVARFGDYRAFAEVPWQAWIIPIIGQLSVFTAQLFFAHRCYTLYRRNKLIFAGLLFGMLASLALFTVVGVVVATDPFNFQRGRELTIPAICVNLSTDLAIAGLTLWKLGLGGGKSYSPNTDDVLQRLRNLTVEAAVPPTICAMLNMSMYLGTGAKDFAFITFGMITPSLYVCSLMLTLNSRRAIRQKFNSPNDGGSLDAGYELSNVLGSNRKTRQTESRRTTIVFATMSGPAFAPIASMGLVDERVEGNEGPELYGRRPGSNDQDELTTPGSSHKELRVDLDRWENEVRSGSPYSTSVSIRSKRTLEAPPLPTPSEAVSKLII